MTRQILAGARLFDGVRFHHDAALVHGGRPGRGGGASGRTHPPGEVTELDGGVLAPGFVDLQVNGGGGVMLGAEGSVGEIETICRAHLRAGTTGLLPTLISATPRDDGAGGRGGGRGRAEGGSRLHGPASRRPASRPAAQGSA